MNVLSRSGAVGFEGISAGAGSRAAAILTDGLGGVDFELSLGGASPFGSEAVSFNAPVAESVDLVGIVESPATRNLATRPNVPVRRRSSLQNQSIGFPPRSQNVAPSMGALLARGTQRGSAAAPSGAHPTLNQIWPPSARGRRLRVRVRVIAKRFYPLCPLFASSAMYPPLASHA